MPTLTDTAITKAIKAVKDSGKPKKVSDIDRLHLLVSVAGSQTWRWSYRFTNHAGKVEDRTLKIGRYPEISITEARDKRREASKLVETGIDPQEHAKGQVAKVKAIQADDFWSACAEWIENNKSRWSEGYLRQANNYMGRYIKDAPIGKRPIREISTAELAAVFKAVAVRPTADKDRGERKAGGAPHVALLLRQWCSAVFIDAIEAGRADRNPTRDTKPIKTPKVRNNRALDDGELKILFDKLKTSNSARQVIISIELLMLTFVRTVELRKAEWKEFDLDGHRWNVPAERMKMGKAHIVPLPEPAIALLKELRMINPTPKSGPDYLFRNARNPAECMPSKTINQCLERLGFNGELWFRAHGFRGTASTTLHEAGFREEVIESQLAHGKRGKVAGAYDKSKHLPKRKLLMNRWGSHIEQLRAETKLQHP